MRWFLVFVVLWATAAFGNENGCYSVPNPQIIDGRIEQSTINCLSIKPGMTLTVRSHGGSSMGGEAIARTIWHKNVTVRVVDYCDSACVSIAAAAERVEICRGATIGVHRSSNGFNDSVRATQRQSNFLRMTLGAESLPIVNKLETTAHYWVSHILENERPLSWSSINCS